MRPYRFVTNWAIEADIEKVWDIISNFDSLGWWEGVSSRKIKPGRLRSGVGAEHAFVFQTKLLYKLCFTTTVTAKQKPHLLEIKARGQLQGKGRCRLTKVGQATHVEYVWEVYTNQRWMNVTAPLLEPAFVWNHDQVMSEGARGISRRLGARLISC